MDALIARRPPVRLAIVMLGVYAVFWIQFWIVRPTNFGGIDEWMILSLVSRGAFEIPYANRPLGLLFNLPVALFPEHLLGASWWLYGHYLVAAGLFTSLLLLRLRPERPELALLAGVFAATWAPSDLLRLNSIYSAAYAGVSAATALVFLLLARGSLPGVSLAAGLAFVVTRVHEAPLPVLLLAPLLLRGLGVALTRTAVAGFTAVMGLAALVAGLPLLLGRAPAWYQNEVLGVYLDAAGLLVRLAVQFRLHLEPIATMAPAALWRPAPLAAAAVLVIALGLLRGAPAPAPIHRRLAFFVAVGVTGAAAAYSSFILASRLQGAFRTEFLAAPWIGLALAAMIVLLADAAPGRARLAVLAGLGALIAAGGSARTRELQATWDGIGSYARQAGTLAQIVRVAPGLEPGTLVLLLDGAQAWVGSFPFHHGLDVVYGRHVAGCVPGGREQLFYECRATRDGYALVPWRVLESAWGEPPRRFRFDEVIVFRLAPDRRVEVVEEWPPDLPALPPGARYAPRERITRADAAPPVQRGLPGF